MTSDVVFITETPPPTETSSSDRAGIIFVRRFCLAACIVLTLFFIVVAERTLLSIAPEAIVRRTPLAGDNANRSRGAPKETANVLAAVRRLSGTVGDFVSFGRVIADGRRFGNQLFNFAAVVFVAELSGRRPALLKFGHRIELEEVFDLDNVDRFDNLCPCVEFGEKRALSYDARVETLANPDNPEVRKKSIVLAGFFQSWKYTRGVESRLRQQLRFLKRLRRATADFFRQSVPSSWKGGFIRVGVHVRRADVLSDHLVRYGYSTPGAGYFRNAMRYFVDRYDRVQFVVCGEDAAWNKEHVVETSFNGSTIETVDVIYSVGRSAAEDFAILSHCDHVIMSTGTYGWWAAWLANGTTVYYEKWPMPKTKLDELFSREDFFPPHWLPMT